MRPQAHLCLGTPPVKERGGAGGWGTLNLPEVLGDGPQPQASQATSLTLNHYAEVNGVPQNDMLES